MSLVCVLVCLLTSNAMDYGRSGVYDSPLANDYYVKRFGFMFGGGRSGKLGMEALQVKYLFLRNINIYNLIFRKLPTSVTKAASLPACTTLVVSMA